MITVRIDGKIYYQCSICHQYCISDEIYLRCSICKNCNKELSKRHKTYQKKYYQKNKIEIKEKTSERNRIKNAINELKDKKLIN